MSNIFKRVSTRLPLIVATAVILCSMACLPFTAQAQEPPSIVGSKPLYSLSRATGWINSKPLTAKQLKGKVVLVDFWTYSCINCLRSMPYIEAWAQKYKSSGLVVIGVSTPEFGFGKNISNVQQAVKKYGITFPVALDGNYYIWNAFHNQFWPADYFIGVHGRVGYEHFGEGNYAESERWIQTLLKQRDSKSAHSKPVPGGIVDVQGRGAEEAPDFSQMRSPETYIGYARVEGFASHGGIKRNTPHLYVLPDHLRLNRWGLGGKWVDHRQAAVLESAGGKIIFRFRARDLNMVLGPAEDGKPIHFTVTIDGHAPGDNHGVDTNAQGQGVVKEYRMYQLIRQRDGVKDQVFTIEFQDPGVQAFTFTFG